MIRMTKQTDYGIVLLSHLAGEPQRQYSAPELAEDTHLPLPMVSKILKQLVRGGLLLSHRGVKGGYSLARSPDKISVAVIIAALEGPIAITECIADSPDECSYESYCRVARNWQRINRAVRDALDAITLAEMAESRPTPTSPLSSRPLRLITLGGVDAS